MYNGDEIAGILNLVRIGCGFLFDGVAAMGNGGCLGHSWCFRRGWWLVLWLVSTRNKQAATRGIRTPDRRPPRLSCCRCGSCLLAEDGDLEVLRDQPSRAALFGEL